MGVWDKMSCMNSPSGLPASGFIKAALIPTEMHSFGVDFCWKLHRVSRIVSTPCCYCREHIAVLSPMLTLSILA